MLHLIRDPSDKFFEVIRQDPVRPGIPLEARVGHNRDVFVSRSDDDNVRAITCVSYQSTVPMDEDQLFESTDYPEVVVFYTIWSYEPGAGRELIFAARDWILENRPGVRRFVTLSPTSDMARKFHIKNGAQVFRSNARTVNYEYL